MTERPAADALAPARSPDARQGGASARDAARVVLVTGISGAGKTLALKDLEDIGYEAVDNLPLSLLDKLVRPGDGPARPLAAGIDIRTRDFGVANLLAQVDALIHAGDTELKLLFLDCDDEVLNRRFTESRRRHPLAADRPLQDGISHERRLLSPLRDRADLVIDTSNLPPGELKRLLDLNFALDRRPALVLFVMSFAYRRGLPREADLVFDARFLDNPHYVDELRPLTGRDPRVAAYVEQDADFGHFFGGLTDWLGPLLPRYAAEGKSYLTIAIGCTGGRHRSVVLAEKLTAWLRRNGQRVEIRHRELEEGAK